MEKSQGTNSPRKVLLSLTITLIYIEAKHKKNSLVAVVQILKDCLWYSLFFDTVVSPVFEVFSSVLVAIADVDDSSQPMKEGKSSILVHQRKVQFIVKKIKNTT